MFKIKYAGPRPIISQHGITYKDAKEDKYIYINTALEILKGIDHNYEETRSYSYSLDIEPFTEKDIHTILQQYDQLLEQKVEQEEKAYELKIEDEIKHVQNMHNITQIEKDVWCENIRLMKEYRIQRAINKIYYFHCINDIAQIIIKQKIKEIDTPYNEKFLHTLHSIQGALEDSRYAYHTDLKEQTDQNDNMILKLLISKVG